MAPRVGYRLDRLRFGEWLMLASAIALLIDLVAFPWYSLRREFSTGLGQLGRATTYPPGQVFHVLTPLAIVCVMLAILVWLAQIAFAAPAVPVTLTVLSTLLNLVLFVGLFVRVLIVHPSQSVLGLPGSNELGPDVASLMGVIFSALLFLGSWWSLRSDGVAEADEPQRIETLRLAPRRG